MTEPQAVALIAAVLLTSMGQNGEPWRSEGEAINTARNLIDAAQRKAEQEVIARRDHNPRMAQSVGEDEA